MKHIDFTFTLEARDVPGVLVRITQVFARRGCNIQSLHVRPGTHSLWTIIDINAYDVPRPDQIKHQLEKLIDIHAVTSHQHAAEGCVYE
jgi:acetolactate synthase-1/3 small subunit